MNNKYSQINFQELSDFEKHLVNYALEYKDIYSVAVRRKVASLIYDSSKELILSKPGHNHNIVDGDDKAVCEDLTNKTLPTVIHAEEHAIFNFLHNYNMNEINDNTVLLTTFFPCWWCAKLILQSKIKTIKFIDYKHEELDTEMVQITKYLSGNGVKLIQIIK